MRRFLAVSTVVLIGMLAAGVANAVGQGITQETTIVLVESTVKIRNIDEAPGEFAPGDAYIFRSKLVDPVSGEGVGRMFVHCVVNFGLRDQCQQVYELTDRGTIVAEGIVPIGEISFEPGDTWPFAVTGGTGEFEGVVGAVTILLTSATDSEHTLHLLP